MRAVPIFALLTALCAPAALAGQTSQRAAPGNSWDENWTKCEGSDPAGRIAGCTALILANKESPKGLATAYMNRGTAYSVGGNYERAIENYDPAIRLDSTNANAFYNRGYAYEAEGDANRALADFTDALRLNPDFVAALEGRGNIHVQQGDYDGALADLDQAVRLDPKHPVGFDLRGNAYDGKGDFDRAIEDYSEGLQLDPKDMRCILDRGLAYVHKGAFDLAIKDYDEAVRMTPDSSSAFDHRGYAYYRKGDSARAIQDYNQAIRLDPKSVDAFDNRANAYDDKGDFEAALKDYAEGLRLAPDDAVMLIDRGLAYGRRGDFDRSIQDFDAAVRLNPNFYSAFIARGDAYAQKGDYDRAIQDYDQALRVIPKSVDALISRGSAYLQKGDSDRAIEDYDQAVTLDPESGDALAGRGDAYLEKKQYDRAIQDYEQSLLLEPKNPSVLGSRAQAYSSLGEYSAAVTDLAAAQKLDPKYVYYPLWLYVARARAGQDGRAELAASTAQMKLTEWPGQVANLFLGKATPEAILAAANSPDAKKNDEQHCEAYFYLAEYALTKGNTAEAKRLFQQSIDTGVKGFVEYADAQAELLRIPADGRTEIAEAKRGLVEEPVAPVAAMQNGKYYALVIGINQYKAPLPQLKTAVGDARAIAAVLHDRYGFEVKLLLDGDATRVNILDAITQYRSRLNENDSLLIYYAGHGYSDHDADKAYWLPVDADSPFSPNRIIADDLTTDVRVEPARHVLIISDSCYSGGLSRDADIIQGSNGQAAFLRKMENSRSRTLMASGGDEPVSDAGTDGHSVFAYAVLKALEGEEGTMFTASDLFYNSVRQQVAGKSEQVPQYSIIRNSNHDEGDFVFVRKGP